MNAQTLSHHAGSSHLISVNFEPQTCRILHGLIQVRKESAGGSTYHVLEAVDAAAIELTTVKVSHFGTRSAMDEAIFKLARPAGVIKTFDRILTSPSNDLFHYHIGYQSVEEARRALTILNFKVCTPLIDSDGPMQTLKVRNRRFEYGKTWFSLPVVDFHRHQATGPHAGTRARDLEEANSTQTDNSIALGPTLNLLPFSAYPPAPPPPSVLHFAGPHHIISPSNDRPSFYTYRARHHPARSVGRPTPSQYHRRHRPPILATDTNGCRHSSPDACTPRIRDGEALSDVPWRALKRRRRSLSESFTHDGDTEVSPSLPHHTLALSADLGYVHHHRDQDLSPTLQLDYADPAEPSSEIWRNGDQTRTPEVPTSRLSRLSIEDDPVDSSMASRTGCVEPDRHSSNTADPGAIADGETGKWS